jgi:hypothetical protein
MDEIKKSVGSGSQPFEASAAFLILTLILLYGQREISCYSYDSIRSTGIRDFVHSENR